MDDLGRRLERWVQAGAIRPDQAEAILRLEGSGEPGTGAPENREGRPEEPGGRRTAVAEVLGYLGGTLAAVGAVVIGARSWADLGRGGRVAALAVVSAALLGAGWMLRGRGRTLDRLAGVLWLLSVGSWAGLLGVLGGGASPGGHTALVVSAGSTAYAGLLWALARRALQQVALFAAAMATVAAVAAELTDDAGLLTGLGFLALALAWLELARRGAVGPRRTAEALGALGAVAGCETIHWDRSSAAGIGLELLVAVGLLVAGSGLRRTVLLGVGAAALFLAVAEVAGQYWRTLGAPVAILLAGLGLLAAALAVARLRPSGG